MSEERTNMAIRDLKHYVIDNMSLDVQDDFEIICKYITNLQQKVEQLEKEIERLNNIIDEADTKNLELIQKINKIYDVIENKNITGIEARLLIQDMLDKEE